MAGQFRPESSRRLFVRIAASQLPALEVVPRAADGIRPPRECVRRSPRFALPLRVSRSTAVRRDPARRSRDSYRSSFVRRTCRRRVAARVLVPRGRGTSREMSGSRGRATTRHAVAGMAAEAGGVVRASTRRQTSRRPRAGVPMRRSPAGSANASRRERLQSDCAPRGRVSASTAPPDAKGQVSPRLEVRSTLPRAGFRLSSAPIWNRKVSLPGERKEVLCRFRLVWP